MNRLCFSCNLAARSASALLASASALPLASASILALASASGIVPAAAVLGVARGGLSAAAPVSSAPSP